MSHTGAFNNACAAPQEYCKKGRDGKPLQTAYHATNHPTPTGNHAHGVAGEVTAETPSTFTAMYSAVALGCGQGTENDDSLESSTRNMNARLRSSARNHAAGLSARGPACRIHAI